MRKGLLLALLVFSISGAIRAQWTKCNLPATAYPNAMAVSGNQVFVGTLASGMYVSGDKGDNWTQINNGFTQMQVWSVSVAGNDVYAGTNGGALFRTSDQGNSWQTVNGGIPSTTIVRMVVKFGDKLFASTSNSGIYVSTDNATSWSQHNAGITGLVAGPLMVANTDLYAGVLQKVYRYDAGAQSWVIASAGIINNTISALVYLKEESGAFNLFAGVSNSGKNVYRSVDSGISWTSAYTGIPSVPVVSMTSAGTAIFTGTDYGVSVSKDMGTNWADANEGFLNTSYGYCLSAGNEDIYVIQQAKVWRRPLSDFGLSTTSANPFELTSGIGISLKNYPNPVGASTTISYALQQAGHVKLTIYDISGKAIVSITDELQQAGSYNQSFSPPAAGLRPGVYFCRLHTGNAEETIKLVVTK